MDSMSVTTLRTAAASAVAANHLARADAHTATIIGCGAQARAHVAALSAVRRLQHAHLFDVDEQKAIRFAAKMSSVHRFESISVTTDLRAATRASDIIVTCTSATKPFLGVDDVTPGAFVAAVGADSEHKHEIEVALMCEAAIVVDDMDQSATIGDLHHAIDGGVLTRADVRATLGELVAGVKPGRLHDDEIIVFDSTGVAIEDVAAASVVFERALRDTAGLPVRLGD
jgi:alanine dehydrogenase